MRRCIELRILEGRSYREIASAMGISINTVKAHLHQAKELLKDNLNGSSRAQGS
jgi:RNA polymerase sigma factor (sigma-70 family)